jgi:methionyl aminopeptidase
MITIKTPQEVKILSEGGKILASVLSEVVSAVKPGISTQDLNEQAERLIKKVGGLPSFLNYKPRGDKKKYPSSMCVSINDEVVHGVPSAHRILQEGDLVSLDLGLEYKKLHTDMAVTVGVGKISSKAEKLIQITKEALCVGIDELKEGAVIGNYGFIVQRFVEKAGFNIVRQLVGHGVGYSLHEDPEILNWGKKGRGLELKSGMVLALEPMVCEGKAEVFLDNDDWTWKTKDGLLSAHFEHTIAIDKRNCRVLTKI